MARALNMVTVAEGIQTEEQVQALRELGCDRGQGFFFGREIHALARERRAHARTAAANFRQVGVAKARSSVHSSSFNNHSINRLNLCEHK